MIGELILAVMLAKTQEPTIALVFGPTDADVEIIQLSEAQELVKTLDIYDEPYRTRLKAALEIALGTMQDPEFFDACIGTPLRCSDHRRRVPRRDN